jgi:hypothetical protein
VSEISGREILVEIGLAGLDPDDAQTVLRLFMEVLEFRVGRRLVSVLGPNWQADFEALTRLQPTPGARERGLRFLEESLPEYGQYLQDELAQLKVEFVDRLQVRMARELS